MVDENQRNWCELTPYVTFAYNMSYHSSTTFSQFYLLYLHEARIPIDLVMENVAKAVLANWNDYVMEMRSRINQTFQTVRDQFGRPFRGLTRPTMAVSKKLQFKVDDLEWFFCPRKTIIKHGTLANREVSQLRQVRGSAGGWT